FGKAHDLLGAMPAGAANPDPEEVAAQRGRLMAKVYVRSRRISIALAAQHRVTPIFFFQPDRLDDEKISPRYTADRLVGPPPIDITDAMKGHQPTDIYLDTGHTNELGAQLVAQAMWRHLRPQVDAWYRTHG